MNPGEDCVKKRKREKERQGKEEKKEENEFTILKSGDTFKQYHHCHIRGRKRRKPKDLRSENVL